MPAVLALPEIGLATAALVLLLLAFALWVLRGFLVAGFSRIPLVGGAIGRSLGGWLDDARAALMRSSSSALHGMTRIWHTCAAWIENVLYKISYAQTAIVTTIEHIATSQVPRLYRAALSWATHQALTVYHAALGWYHDALAGIAAARAWAVQVGLSVLHQSLAFATLQYHAAVAYAAVLFAQAETNLARDIAAARAFTSVKVAELARATEAEISRAESISVSLFRTAEADALREIGSLDAKVSAELAAGISGLVTDLEVLGNRAVSEVWPDALRDIDALKQVLGDSFPDIQSLLKYLEGAGAAGLIGALIRALAGSAVATRALEDCVIPNCKNLSQLGRELSQLGSAASTAALLGWLAFIATDPVTAADDTVAVADPFINDIFGPLAGLLSAGASKL